MLPTHHFKGFTPSVFAVLISLFTGFTSYAQAARPELFSEYQIVLPFNLTQPVLAANLLDYPGNELLMLGVNPQGQRQLAIYILDSSGHMQLVDQLTLGDHLFAYDVGDPDKQGLQHLYFLSKNQLYRYQYVGAQNQLEGPRMAAPPQDNIPRITNSLSRLQELATISSMYLNERADAIETLDFAKDINHDQRDDFVLAHFESLNLYLSDLSSTGSDMLQHQSLPIAALLRVNGSEVSFQARDLLFADMDLDHKTDLVQVVTGQLRVFQQTPAGRFKPEPMLINLAADIEGIDWWDIIDADGQQPDQSQLRHKKVEGITDVDGDGLPDLIVRFTQSSGVLERTNDYEYFYGLAGEQSVTYSQEADTRIQSASTLSDLKWLDLDQDGKQEMMLSAFDLGVSQIISALLSSSIEQEAVIFKMDDNKQFSAKPTASQDVEITFSLSSGRSGEPMVKAQDINGDQLKDLIFSDGEEQIKVLFASQGNKRLFEKRAEKYKVKVPKNAKAITHNDINLDGKMDLILHYSRADAGDLLNKVVVLIAN